MTAVDDALKAKVLTSVEARAALRCAQEDVNQAEADYNLALHRRAQTIVAANRRGGLKLDEIGEELGPEGHPLHKTTVSNIIKRYLTAVAEGRTLRMAHGAKHRKAPRPRRLTR